MTMADSNLTAYAEQLLANTSDDELFMEAAPILMHVDRLTRRAAGVKALRAQHGKDLGRDARAQLEEMHTELARLAIILEGAA